MSQLGKRDPFALCSNLGGAECGAREAALADGVRSQCTLVSVAFRPLSIVASMAPAPPLAVLSRKTTLRKAASVSGNQILTLPPHHGTGLPLYNVRSKTSNLPLA